MGRNGICETKFPEIHSNEPNFTLKFNITSAYRLEKKLENGRVWKIRRELDPKGSLKMENSKNRTLKDLKF